jgi:hypothetical protein
MAGVTNRGKFLLLQEFFRATGAPTNIFAALITDAVVPTEDTDTFSELTEIAAGNGYTAGGISLTRNATDFDVLTENDGATDNAIVQVKDLVWTASSGPLPASGDGARYLVLTDDDATPGDRQIIAFFDLGSAITVSDGQPLTVQDTEIQLTEPA